MKGNKAGNTLAPFVQPLQVGQQLGHMNLTLLTLQGEPAGQLEYLLSADALAAGTLTITEVSEGGSVPELLAVNEGQQMVLLLDGEELVGAKQNRILNTSVLLGALSKTQIDVSCVEQGRWRSVSSVFSAGAYSPSRLRARKSRDVSRNLATEGRARSDQLGMWQEVASGMAASAVHSPTMAMHDVVEQRRDVLAGFVEALAYPAGARGVIAAIDGRFAAMDLFDKPTTLGSIWSRLITGYAMDAIAAGHDKARQFTAKGAHALVEHLAQLECQAFASAGIGQDWRFEAPDVLGQALVYEGVCLHLSAFPAMADDAAAPSGPLQYIEPPSRRRRSGRGPGQMGTQGR